MAAARLDALQAKREAKREQALHRRQEACVRRARSERMKRDLTMEEILRGPPPPPDGFNAGRASQASAK